MKKLLLFIFPTLLLFNCGNVNSDNKDKNDLSQYNSNFGDFSFLSIPSPDFTTINKPSGSLTSDIYMYSYEYKGYSVSFSYYKYTTEPAGIENEAILTLEHMVDGGIKKSNSTLIESKNISLGEIPGIEFLSNDPTGIKNRARYFLKDLKYVYMTIISNENNASLIDSIPERIINSLEIGTTKQNVVTSKEENTANSKSTSENEVPIKVTDYDIWENCQYRSVENYQKGGYVKQNWDCFRHHIDISKNNNDTSSYQIDVKYIYPDGTLLKLGDSKIYSFTQEIKLYQFYDAGNVALPNGRNLNCTDLNESTKLSNSFDLVKIPMNKKFPLGIYTLEIYYKEILIGSTTFNIK